MKRNRGFTLVELLVVIGIIALLISILLPSLNRVRWQAQTIACAARMRDVTNCIIMYAGDNKGWLPPYAGDTGQSNFTAYFQSEWAFAANSFSTSPVPAITKNDSGAQLGRLWKLGYIKTPKVFWCPSLKGDVPFNAPLCRDFSYYTYNPHFKYVPDPTNSANRLVQVWWRRLPNYGKVDIGQNYVYYSGTIQTGNFTPWRRAILMDTIYNYGSAGNLENVTHLNGKRRSYNMAYPDGHVATFTDGNWMSRETDTLVRMLDLSNALQDAADGNPIDWTSSWVNQKYNAIPLSPTN